MPSSVEEKIKARRKTRWAIESGKLSREPCARCGEPETLPHHEDYDRPLDVVWLCRSCHSHHHRIYPATKECAVCGATFTPAPTKRKRAKTCSPKCHRAAVATAAKARGKLSDEDRAEIRRRWPAETQTALAAEFGVRQSSIWQVLRDR